MAALRPVFPVRRPAASQDPERPARLRERTDRLPAFPVPYPMVSSVHHPSA
jgi:hypothetical protein